MPEATYRAFREGDSAAFQEVVLGHAGVVRSVVSRFWKSEFEREDAAQEIWLHLFRQREQLDPERLEQVGGWIRTLARSKCIDLLRRQGRQVPVKPEEELKVPAPAGPESDPEVGARKLALGEAVQTFLEGLGPDFSDFFRHHFVEGLTQEETAARLSVPVHRTKYMKRVLLSRARSSASLRTALGRYQEVLHAS
ncbi:MAG: RNA polymerase sigma factor [Deltaproteobacteria bacterium]|nr:RNA polymerase sigma factor [Deltaproteobacteria bacterium]